jgi:hypothetical protein
MQIIVEIVTAIVVWTAAVVLSHFGVDVDLHREAEARVERVIEKTRPHPVSTACPEAKVEATAPRRDAI